MDLWWASKKGLPRDEEKCKKWNLTALFYKIYTPLCFLFSLEMAKYSWTDSSYDWLGSSILKVTKLFTKTYCLNFPNFSNLALSWVFYLFDFYVCMCLQKSVSDALEQLWAVGTAAGIPLNHLPQFIRCWVLRLLVTMLPDLTELQTEWDQNTTKVTHAPWRETRRRHQAILKHTL